MTTPQPISKDQLIAQLRRLDPAADHPPASEATLAAKLSRIVRNDAVGAEIVEINHWAPRDPHKRARRALAAAAGAAAVMVVGGGVAVMNWPAGKASHSPPGASDQGCNLSLTATGGSSVPSPPDTEALGNAAERISELEADRDPATFAGVWLDGASGTVVICLTRSPAPERLASLSSELPAGARLQVGLVLHNLSYLQALMDQITGEEANLYANSGITVSAVGQDIRMNRVDVWVDPSAPSDAERVLVAKFGDGIFVQRSH